MADWSSEGFKTPLDRSFGELSETMSGIDESPQTYNDKPLGIPMFKKNRSPFLSYKIRLNLIKKDNPPKLFNMPIYSPI
jgi:hypothetical protein